jgi:hypothetical protein
LPTTTTTLSLLNPSLNAQQVEDVLAYLLTLKEE